MAFLTRTAAIVAVVVVLAACAGQSTSPSPDPTSINVFPTYPTLSPSPAAATTATPASTQDAVDPFSGLPWVNLSDLPPEAAHTADLIKSHGPFPHSQDGVIYENREGILPAEASGYYHEYTVDTPGSSDRGARRIVTGSNGEMYYTDDHYDSFERIRDD